VIRATDGEIGTVDQLYFDDETWAIRYLDGSKPAAGLSGRESADLANSPSSHVDWQGQAAGCGADKKASGE
jgi:hypothetical protein